MTTRLIHAALAQPAHTTQPAPRIWCRVLTTAAAVGLASCASTPPPTARALPIPTPQTAQQPAAPQGKVSLASSAREYRRDAAQHLYNLNANRIYPGPMPPLLQAVGVLQVHLDGNGQVRKLEWMRAPSHVPAVVAEIERTVRAAAPYPAPKRLGQVVYTDVWLWDKSGRFQLDTLTEGQRSTM